MRDPLGIARELVLEGRRSGILLRAGVPSRAVGDVEVKRKLVEVLNGLLESFRARRRSFEARPDVILDELRSGTAKAIAVAEETLRLAKKALRQDCFQRTLVLR